MLVQLLCPNPACGEKATAPDPTTARGLKCQRCGTALVALGALVDNPETHVSLDYSALADRQDISLEMPELPKQIGRYKILSQLGAGAFGKVYRALDPNLQREVALKVLHPDCLANTKAAERFTREAAAGARLLHPYIATFVESGQDGEQHYIVSGLVNGETLQDALKRGRWDFRRGAKVVAQLAEALAYAHKQGIVHRDVKPSNILIDEQGNPRLLDFGLASLHDARAMTTLGTPLGTPAYTAPEQADGSNSRDKAVDQYSLGVVLYELLCGEVPFAGPPGYVISCQASEAPSPPRERNPELPPELEAICLKALAKKPKDRYADCQGLADELQRWWLSTPVPAIPLTQIEPAGKPSSVLLSKVAEPKVTANGKPLTRQLQDVARWGRRKPIVFAIPAVALLGVLMTCLLLFNWLGSRDSKLEVKKGADPVPAKQIIITNSIGMKLVYIAPGKFLMGAPNSQREVEITKGFYMGVYAVTQEEYGKLSRNNSHFSNKSGNDKVAGIDTRRFPVEIVNWHEAKEFCQKLSEKEGKDYRLPTEAEWEYACRAGTTTAFHFGETISTDQANFDGRDDSGKGVFRGRPMPVGSFAANAWGLYDMHGNVSQWCDNLNDTGNNVNSPKGGDPKQKAMGTCGLRGGSWSGGSMRSRPYSRTIIGPGTRNNDIGFRVVLPSLQPKPAPEKPKPAPPQLVAALKISPIQAIRIEPGKFQDILVNVERQDCKGAVDIKIAELPTGISAQPVVLPADKDEIALKLVVAPDAKGAPFDAKVQASLGKLTAEKTIRISVQLPPIENSIGMKLVYIAPGKFLMGSPDEEKERSTSEFQHEAELTRGFYMGAYAVTQEEYLKVMDKNPSDFSAQGDRKDKVADQDTKRFPVEQVSWEDAKEFCRKLGQQEGKEYRLPSEAEWEYACRAGTTTPFHFGATISTEQANYNGNFVYGKGKKGEYRERPRPVGSFAANAWGLYDMHGNVWQWCEDWYDAEYYTTSPKMNPSNENETQLRVLRGGSWNPGPSVARSAFRSAKTPDFRDDVIGFRVVLPSPVTVLKTIPIQPVKIDAGKFQDIVVTVERQNCQGAVDIKITDLPAGVTAQPAALPRDKSEVTIKLIAALEAKEATFDAKVVVSLGKLTAERAVRVSVRSQVLAKKIANSIGMKLVYIAPGKFLRGSPNNEIERYTNEFQREVELSKGFYMGVHAVTQEEYESMTGKRSFYFSAQGGGSKQVTGIDTRRFPVENVDWFEAKKFCQSLSQKEKKEYRLPTEAEWEFACRAGTATPFFFGDTISTGQANYNGKFAYGNGLPGVDRERPLPVGSFAANAWGLHDMHGNVWQWCEDFYDVDYYKTPPKVNPLNETPSKLRVLRGGSWLSDPRYVRSAYRNSKDPYYRSNFVGFRVVLSVP